MTQMNGIPGERIFSLLEEQKCSSLSSLIYHTSDKSHIIWLNLSRWAKASYGGVKIMHKGNMEQ